MANGNSRLTKYQARLGGRSVSLFFTIDGERREIDETL